MSKRKLILPFGKLHNLTTFEAEGVTYRKTEACRAIRADGGVGIFYPTERVSVLEQPPRTMLLWQAPDEATITLPSITLADEPVQVEVARTMYEPTVPVSILAWGN